MHVKLFIIDLLQLQTLFMYKCICDKINCGTRRRRSGDFVNTVVGLLHNTTTTLLHSSRIIFHSFPSSATRSAWNACAMSSKKSVLAM